MQTALWGAEWYSWSWSRYSIWDLISMSMEDQLEADEIRRQRIKQIEDAKAAEEAAKEDK